MHKILLYFFVAYKINIKNLHLVCKAFHSMALLSFSSSLHYIPIHNHLLHTHVYTLTALKLWPHSNTQHSLKNNAGQLIKLFAEVLLCAKYCGRPIGHGPCLPWARSSMYFNSLVVIYTVPLVRNSHLCLHSFKKHLLSTCYVPCCAIFWKCKQ